MDMLRSNGEASTSNSWNRCRKVRCEKFVEIKDGEVVGFVENQLQQKSANKR